MGQASLVMNQIDDGRKLVEELARGGFDVTAALWLKDSEQEQWHLYIASKTVDDQGLAEAYKEVLTTIRRMPDLWIDSFDIKLIGATNPITQDVLDLQKRHPARIPTRYGGNRLGNVYVDEAYIYPPIAIP